MTGITGSDRLFRVRSAILFLDRGTGKSRSILGHGNNIDWAIFQFEASDQVESVGQERLNHKT